MNDHSQRRSKGSRGGGNTKAIVLRGLLFYVLNAVSLAAIAPLVRAEDGMTQGVYIGALTSIVAFAITGLFLRWDGLKFANVGCRLRTESWKPFTIGFGLGLLLVATHTVLWMVSGTLDLVWDPQVELGHVFWVALAYLLLSTREELVFHGYLLRRLESTAGIVVAQIGVAALFAIEHFIGGHSLDNAIFGAAIGSLLFGMVSIATRGLAMPIGMHMAWNLGDWLRGNKGTGTLWTMVPDETTDWAHAIGLASYVSVMLAATVAFWLWNRTVVDGGGISPKKA